MSLTLHVGERRRERNKNVTRADSANIGASGTHACYALICSSVAPPHGCRAARSPPTSPHSRRAAQGGTGRRHSSRGACGVVDVHRYAHRIQRTELCPDSTEHWTEAERAVPAGPERTAGVGDQRAGGGATGGGTERGGEERIRLRAN